MAKMPTFKVNVTVAKDEAADRVWDIMQQVDALEDLVPDHLKADARHHASRIHHLLCDIVRVNSKPLNPDTADELGI